MESKILVRVLNNKGQDYSLTFDQPDAVLAVINAIFKGGAAAEVASINLSFVRSHAKKS